MRVCNTQISPPIPSLTQSPRIIYCRLGYRAMSFCPLVPRQHISQLSCVSPDYKQIILQIPKFRKYDEKKFSKSQENTLKTCVLKKYGLTFSFFSIFLLYYNTKEIPKYCSNIGMVYGISAKIMI